MGQPRAKFYVRIGGALGDVGEAKFGFRAPADAYDGIGDELGVTKLTNNSSARGVLFGANYPKPPKVRISYRDSNLGGGATNDVLGSAFRYCDPDKLGAILNGSLNDAKIKVNGKEYSVDSVSI
ncbi:MAG: hypothetical protein AAGF24_08065 [Cyanobacteria bacterium P01_H01_bin.121]